MSDPCMIYYYMQKFTSRIKGTVFPSKAIFRSTMFSVLVSLHIVSQMKSEYNQYFSC